MPTFCRGNFGKVDDIIVWSSVPEQSCLTVHVLPLKMIFSLTYTPTVKWPFFPHFLQIITFVGHTSMSWLGLFPHLGHQLGIVLCHLHEEKLVASESFLTAEYMSQPFSE